MEKLKGLSDELPLEISSISRQQSKLLNIPRTLFILLSCFGISFWFTFLNRYSIAGRSIIDGIEWSTCGDNIDCGSLEVPLDYADPSIGNATLALARYRATNQKARIGTLLTNPGGPGGSGVNYIYRAGQRISEILDGRYDIVSWDPRGINGTTPRVECFDTETAQDIFIANTHQEIMPDSRNLSDPIDLAIYTSGLRLADARNAALAELCIQKSGEALRHVGTATVVRDLDRIYRTLEGDDKPINFWGFSYGTVVGSYLVNMFPDRVGRVAIDGVVNPDLWANTHSHEWLKDDFVDSEKDLRNFYAACAAAGPGRCALASDNSTASSISDGVKQLLDDLYDHPLPVLKSQRPGALTQSMVRAYIFTNLYRPRDWPKLASFLDAAIKGNGTDLMNAILSNPELDTGKPAQTIFSITAVTCVDTPGFEGVTKEEAFQDSLEEIVIASNVSPTFASLEFDMCSHWSIREAERFTGPFNHTLSNTILIIGNTADPITPLQNARAVNDLMPHSSRLVIQDGSGHCSSAMASLCTARTIKEYFTEGELPLNGLLCSTDEKLFPEQSISSDASWLTESQSSYSAEDLQLLHSIQALGKELELFVSGFKKPHSPW